jgi:AcrR family transcriptional regulator
MDEESKLTGLKKHSEEINRIVKESLREALLFLLSRKEYDKITITELCQKAGVSRMAFYGNFKSKDDILQELVLEVYRDLVREMGSPFRETTTKEWYISFFRFVERRTATFDFLFDVLFREEHLRFLNDIILADPAIPVEKKYQRLLWSGGLENATAYWLKNGMKESIEEMAQYCDDNLRPWSCR